MSRSSSVSGILAIGASSWNRVEKETAYPPTNLLSQFAKALGVSADQLLGIEAVREAGRNRDSRLWRRFKQLEKLPAAQRRPILQVLDAFLTKTTS